MLISSNLFFLIYSLSSFTLTLSKKSKISFFALDRSKRVSSKFSSLEIPEKYFFNSLIFLNKFFSNSSLKILGSVVFVMSFLAFSASDCKILKALLYEDTTVSYTHLTLPTILLV